MSDSIYESKWEEFITECNACKNCGLREGASNVVIYRGNRKASLMIIGEAPGATEDEKGKPFVGRSGMLLQNLLGSVGLTEEDYHICNIVKCRPPENRRPKPNEIASCKRLLAKQFALVRPKIILLCGSTAYEAFFNEKAAMHACRGHFAEKNGYSIMTTFHPAYALRDPSKKIPMYDDMMLVRRKLDEMLAQEATDS